MIITGYIGECHLGGMYLLFNELSFMRPVTYFSTEKNIYISQNGNCDTMSHKKYVFDNSGDQNIFLRYNCSSSTAPENASEP